VEVVVCNLVIWVKLCFGLPYSDPKEIPILEVSKINVEILRTSAKKICHVHDVI